MRLTRGDLYALLGQLDTRPACGHRAEDQRLDIEDVSGWEENAREAIPVVCVACEADEAARVAALPPRSPAETAAVKRWALDVFTEASRPIFWDGFDRLAPHAYGKAPDS